MHTVGLKTDVTVRSVGNNAFGACNVSDWADIAQVATGYNHTVGLKSDGKVVAVGRNFDGECNVSGWTGITQVACGYGHTIGVKANGTVVATGNNSYGLCDVGSWTGITQVAAGEYHTVGLRSDGTAVAVGADNPGSPAFNYGQGKVSSWTGIIQISAGRFHTVGLTANGTVIALGYNWDGRCNVSSWDNIIQVSAGYNHTAGLRADRTVTATGDNSYGQCDVSGWTDIIQVSAGYQCTIGLKADGTLVTAGNNGYGQCNVSDWNLGVDTSNDSMHFQFSPISSPQSINSPIQVTLRAVDGNGITKTGYNGTVLFSSTVGRITPTEVNLESGQKTFEVTVQNGGKAKLIAYTDGVFGYSNDFSIQCSGSTTTSISGKVIDCLLLGPVYNAQVILSTNDESPVQVASDTTSLFGNFTLNGISCGTYEISVRYLDVNNQERVKQGIQVNVSGSLPILMPDIVIPTRTPTQSTPVVLVPGFMGSTKGGDIYPRLSPDIIDPNLRIYDLSGIVGFQALKRQLIRNGFMVIDCPWDWRLKMENAYRMFLMPKLAEAKTYSTSGKVHVVAHSMGGLLVREYIQSDADYDSDIDKFAMVGTPNLGSCNPYYVWEGGDSKLLDDITDGFWNPVSTCSNSYTNTIQRLWEKTYHKKKWDEDHYREIRRFVRQVGPSMRQLTSTESFLYSNLVTPPHSPTGDNKNDWLERLNIDPNVSRMSGDGANNTVHVGLFVGNRADSTIKTISVDDPNELYDDGVPSPSWWKRYSAVKGNGDGTVPLGSARYPHDIGKWADEPVTETENTKHMGLIKAFTNNNALLNFLTGAQSAASRELVQGFEAEADGEEPTSNLYVSLDGSVRCYITDPGGRHSGIDSGTGNPIEEIPGTSMAFDVYGGSVGMANPADGTYTVTIWGEGQQDYGVEVGYIDASRSDVLENKGFVPSHPLTFTVRVNSATVPRITITPAVPAPDNLTTKSYLSGTSLLTRLNWGAVSGASITGYNIYAAGETDPSYAYVGTIPVGTLSYDTSDPWCASSGIPVRSYVVTAVRANGTESFFSNEAQNTPSKCECDLNADGKCDMRDWLLFGRQWGHTDCDSVYCPCDLNADGRCDMRDWLLFGKNWGRTDCPLP